MSCKYKAIFFDRDGTLTYNDPTYEKFRDEKISEWSGRDFLLPHERFVRIFKRVFEDGHSFAPYKNMDDELMFFNEWYKLLLVEEGILDNISEKADLLTQKLWYLYKKLYSETIEVLKYFKSRGYKMGVISDCPPSLEHTLKMVGIADYFSSFTASSLVGAGKPNPIIFNAALCEQGVIAEECLYVDDTKIEAEGARELGFTSFYLDRECVDEEEDWKISDLRQIVEFVEKVG